METSRIKKANGTVIISSGIRFFSNCKTNNIFLIINEDEDFYTVNEGTGIFKIKNNGVKHGIGDIVLEDICGEAIKIFQKYYVIAIDEDNIYIKHSIEIEPNIEK